MLTLEHLTLAYGERTLLHDATATLEAGRLIALLGRNGSGKSTLLRTIAGLEAPRRGCIRFDGRDRSSLTPRQMAATVGFVTTDKIRIANLSCAELVGLGRAPYTDWIGRLSDTDRRIVERALQQVGMEDYARRTMDTLSDGECQRVMIARALAQDTPVVLLDEPTAFLDLPNRYELCTLLRDLAHDAGKCILFSTHELDIALTLCDSIALIDTPRLHVLPVEEMIASGHIERLFDNATVGFDARSQTVRLK